MMPPGAPAVSSTASLAPVLTCAPSSASVRKVMRKGRRAAAKWRIRSRFSVTPEVNDFKMLERKSYLNKDVDAKKITRAFTHR